MDIEVKLETSFKIAQDVEQNKYTLEVECLTSESIPLEVLLFKRDVQGIDTFHAVVTPQQIELYHADTPSEGQCFFRKKIALLSFDTVDALLTAKTSFLTLLGKLVTDYQKIASEITTEEVITFEAP